MKTSSSPRLPKPGYLARRTPAELHSMRPRVGKKRITRMKKARRPPVPRGEPPTELATGRLVAVPQGDPRPSSRELLSDWIEFGVAGGQEGGRACSVRLPGLASGYGGLEMPDGGELYQPPWTF